MSDKAREPMLERADDAARLLRAMAHGPRLRILCLLLDGEVGSGEIARALGLRGAAASQQLSLLRAERLIDARREGRRVIYMLANPLVSELVGTLRRQFCPVDGAAPSVPPPAPEAAPPRRAAVRKRWCA